MRICTDESCDASSACTTREVCSVEGHVNKEVVLFFLWKFENVQV